MALLLCECFGFNALHTNAPHQQCQLVFILARQHGYTKRYTQSTAELMEQSFILKVSGRGQMLANFKNVWLLFLNKRSVFQDSSYPVDIQKSKISLCVFHSDNKDDILRSFLQRDISR